MREAMRVELIELAKQKRIVTYSELALLLPVYIHPGSYAFTRLLGQVCSDEFEAKHALLCALVVSKAQRYPRRGFLSRNGRARHRHRRSGSLLACRSRAGLCLLEHQ